jgi:hypothetical protein
MHSIAHLFSTHPIQRRKKTVSKPRSLRFLGFGSTLKKGFVFGFLSNYIITASTVAHQIPLCEGMLGLLAVALTTRLDGSFVLFRQPQ